MEKFLDNIEKKYISELKSINDSVEQIFEEKNKRCLDNIKNIFFIVQSSQFKKMVIEYGSTFSIKSESLFMKDKNSQKRINELLLLKKYKNLPLSKYYYKANSIDNLTIDISIGYNFIQINDEKFTTIGSLYYSIYRFLFYKFSYTEFKHCIEEILENINVIKN